MLEPKSYYDEVPYFSAAFKDCSPIRIKAISQILGFKTPCLENAKILEIGCSYGGNILPFALKFKNSKVLGVDISKIQIDKGIDIAKNMNLNNFQLLNKDIVDLNLDEKFDYIILHGVYSWVDKKTRSCILDKISELLSDDGIAYISYNIYPGWKSLDIVRDFMIFSSRNQTPKEALNTSKDRLNFLHNFLKFQVSNLESGLGKLSQNLLLSQVNFVKNLIKPEKDYYIFHEFLEQSNEPTYFYKFCDEIKKRNLFYFVDSSLDDIFKSSSGAIRFDNYIKKNYKNTIDQEQIYDFLFNRSFRKSLITKHNINKFNINEENLYGLYFSADIKKQDNRYFINNQEIFQKEICELFIDKKCLSFEEICEELGQKLAFESIMVLLSVDLKIRFEPCLDLKDKKDKVSIKENIIPYLKYFAENPNPEILFADELNERVLLDQYQIKTALKFNGKNDFNSIAKFVKDNFLHLYEQNIDEFEYLDILIKELHKSNFLMI